MQLALFDFDGTLTDRDTMLAFCRHVRGPLRFWAGMVWLTPVFGLMFLKWMPAEVAKVRFLRHFLGGMERVTLETWARSFAVEVDTWMRPGALERLAWHRDEGHDVAVVSASVDIWLLPWMEKRGLRCLCSRAAFEDDVFTGRLDGANCNHEEKVRRVRAEYDLSVYARIYAYGDSKGDQAMLALAHEPTFRPFR
jgi:HAD superfamily hydrolase (TIGR01490 family)